VKTGGDIDIECFNNKFSNLETLDLSNSTITNLRGFPKLKNLKKLDMSNNRLSRGLESLKDCENLTQIILSYNKIKELDVLEPLGNLKHLTHLELGLGDELPPEVGYRAKVFSMIPSLQYLDQEDIDGNVEEEEEEHVNGNGLAEEDDDLDDGDDELEDEEAEVEDEEEESDVEEGVTSGIDTLYPSSALLNHHQDYEEEEGSDDDEEEDLEDSEEEEVESTRGKRSPTESTRGKKRKLESEGDPDSH